MATVEYHGVYGNGKTRKEALADAKERFQRAQNGDYSPIVIRWRKWIGLATLAPNGYETRVFDVAERANESALWPEKYLSYRHGCTMTGEYDVYEVEASLRLHLAELGWTPEDGDTELPDILTPEWCREKQGDYRSWAQWQLTIHQWREKGAPIDVARAMADERRRPI